MRHGFDPTNDPVILVLSIPVLILVCYLVRRVWLNYLHRHRNRRRPPGDLCQRTVKTSPGKSDENRPL